jgi:hypothetical protein
MKRTQTIPKIWMTQRSKKNFRRLFPEMTEVKLEINDLDYGCLYLRGKKVTKTTIWTKS